MGYHKCKMLEVQDLEIIFSNERKGRIASIIKGKEQIEIQFCPGCGIKITDWDIESIPNILADER